MIKKTSGFLLIVMIAFILTGCGLTFKSNSESGLDDNRIKIVSTMFAGYDFARTVAGHKAEVSMLLKPGAEAHSFEPTPKDIITIENCDIFIYVGGENDVWVDKILAAVDNPDMIIIKMLDLIDNKYEEEIVEGMQTHEKTDDAADDEVEWDEHVWTNPKNAIIISEEICRVLSNVDADNMSYFNSKMSEYKNELEKLNDDFADIVANSKRKEIIFGDRFPLRYFSEAYGLSYYAAFPGCAAESEPSCKTLAFLIDKVRADDIQIVFKIELSNGNIAETIASDCDIEVRTFYSCHNISDTDFRNGETYLSLMKKNLITLKEALN